MAERWALCDRCDRWFYAQSDMSDSYQLRCPVCDSPPSKVREGKPDTSALA